MNALTIIFIIALSAYILYGIYKTLANRNLSLLHKALWIIIIVSLPVLGTSAYLRTTFKPRRYS